MKYFLILLVNYFTVSYTIFYVELIFSVNIAFENIVVCINYKA